MRVKLGSFGRQPRKKINIIKQMLSQDFESPLDRKDDIRKEMELTSDCLLQYVWRQKLAYFGHIVRHDGLEERVLEVTIPGKRSRGRPRCRWDRTVREAFGSTEKMFFK